MPVEEEESYKQLMIPQMTRWSTEQVIVELRRKMNEHVNPARAIIRMVGATDGVTRRLSVRDWTGIAIRLGVTITQEQAHNVLVEVGLPDDGSLTIAHLLRTFRRIDGDEDGSEPPSPGRLSPLLRRRRDPEVQLVHPPPEHMDLQALAHELVRKLEASSSSDKRLLMDLSNMLRQSAIVTATPAASGAATPPAAKSAELTNSAGGSLSAQQAVTPALLVLLFRRYGLEVSEPVAREIWRLYGLGDNVSIGDFIDGFIGSSLNHVMHPRHTQPAVPMSPGRAAPPRQPTFRRHAEQRASQTFAFSDDLLMAQRYAWGEDGAEHTARSRSTRRSGRGVPRGPPINTPRRQAAAAMREEKLMRARARKQYNERRAPEPMPHNPHAAQSGSLRAPVREPAGMPLHSPRRLVSPLSTVELNTTTLPETKRERLLAMYNSAMEDGKREKLMQLYYEHPPPPRPPSAPPSARGPGLR